MSGLSVNVCRHGSVYIVVSCFGVSQSGLVFPNRPTVLFKLVFGGKSASLDSAAALLSYNRYTLKAVLVFYPRNFKLACTAMCVRPCYLGEEEIVRRDKKMAWYVPRAQ